MKPAAVLILVLIYLSITFSSPLDRIVGGSDAQPGQFPYSVAIYVIDNETNSRIFCGGALISHEWILTAAECVYKADLFTIELGSIYLNATDKVTVTTSTYEIYPGFDINTLVDDIGLIKLQEPIEYNENIQPVLLPYEPLNENFGTLAIGWGSVRDYTDGLSNTLQFVNLNQISTSECQAVYGPLINDRMLCLVGKSKEGTCYGDTGSPLLEYQSASKSIRLVGIASFVSSNGCESTDPSGYTRTYSFIDWIRNVTNIKN